MALFGRKTESEKKTAVAPTKASSVSRDLSSVLVSPRITEKAALLTDKRVYTFVVKAGATKYDVRDAVQVFYKVTPVKIRIVNRPARKAQTRGRKTVLSGMRKAYVYLKEGDRIDLA